MTNVRPLTARERELLSFPRFARVKERFEAQCTASREHSALAGMALREYGAHGPQISGCVREHFPENVKTRLRELAGLASSRDAYEARPRGVRLATIRAIGRAVAARDGSGFYGPQP